MRRLMVVIGFAAAAAFLAFMAGRAAAGDPPSPAQARTVKAFRLVSPCMIGRYMDAGTASTLWFPDDKVACSVSFDRGGCAAFGAVAEFRDSAPVSMTAFPEAKMAADCETIQVPGDFYRQVLDLAEVSSRKDRLSQEVQKQGLDVGVFKANTPK